MHLPSQAGSATAVQVPRVPFFTQNATLDCTKATLLLFVALGVNSTEISFGAPSNISSLCRLRLVLLSPLAANATVQLSGGFFDLHGETVRLTIEREGSPSGGGATTVSSRMLWEEPQTGQR